MLYSIPEVKIIDRVPHASEYRRWKAELNRVDPNAYATMLGLERGKLIPQAGYRELIGGIHPFSPSTRRATMTKLLPVFSSVLSYGMLYCDVKTVGRLVDMRRMAYLYVV